MKYFQCEDCGPLKEAIVDLGDVYSQTLQGLTIKVILQEDNVIPVTTPDILKKVGLFIPAYEIKNFEESIKTYLEIASVFLCPKCLGEDCYVTEENSEKQGGQGLDHQEGTETSP